MAVECCHKDTLIAIVLWGLDAAGGGHSLNESATEPAALAECESVRVSQLSCCQMQRQTNGEGMGCGGYSLTKTSGHWDMHATRSCQKK